VRNAVIVLNGASSSGKSSIAVELQGLLPRPFLTFGVDTLVASLPPASPTHQPGIIFGSDGVVAVVDRFRLLAHTWYQGLGAIARDDVGVIIDEVFLGGRESQDRLRSALGGLRVVWVGVRCDLEVAVAREVARPERTQGMASSQAMIVHEGVHYDLQVDTTTNTALECATTIADNLAVR
jgi:chloramphenicol 3-O phosphotransferase